MMQANSFPRRTLIQDGKFFESGLVTH